MNAVTRKLCSLPRPVINPAQPDALTSQPSGEAVGRDALRLADELDEYAESYGSTHLLVEDAKAAAATLRALYTHPSADAPGVAVDEWRPIESAPKDGTRIALVNAENGICATAEWQHWIVGDKHGLWVSWPYIHGYPTGWMPLPALTVSESNHHGA